MSSGVLILTFLAQYSIPPLLPATISSSRFCTKTTHRASGGACCTRRRRETREFGARRYWMWCAGSEGWVLSVSLVLRVLMRIQIYSLQCDVVFAARQHTIVRRADMTEGMAGAILARGDDVSLVSSREQAHDGNGRRYSWRRVVSCAHAPRFSTQSDDLKHEKLAQTTLQI
ncbi:hypothetical protein EV421DRAFT_1854359 [Armillaria borealis]|uniref:Uncharacterized protein n=1 Tax=Armillaria borealis TaxID=47425 RepID=A0AA39IVK0_9AGAR|nr:hypothetical protein EV421DRAFT_1854359 [Armillaria borealis]